MAELVLFGLNALKGLASCGAKWRIQQEHLIQEVEIRLIILILFGEVLIQRYLIVQDDLIEVLQLDELRDEFLQVIEMVFEKGEIAQLGCHSFADINFCDHSILVELRIINWEIH